MVSLRFLRAWLHRYDPVFAYAVDLCRLGLPNLRVFDKIFHVAAGRLSFCTRIAIDSPCLFLGYSTLGLDSSLSFGRYLIFPVLCGFFCRGYK